MKQNRCSCFPEAIGGEDEEEEVLMRTIEKRVRKRGDGEQRRLKRRGGRVEVALCH